MTKETEQIDRGVRYRYARKAAVRAALRCGMSHAHVTQVADRAAREITRGQSVETAVAEAKHLIRELSGIDADAPDEMHMATAFAVLGSMAVIVMRVAGLIP